MEILIEDIPTEGMDIEATEKDAWLAGALKDALGESCEAGCSARLSLHLARVDGNVNVDGDVHIVAHPACDRCLTVFEESGTVHVHEIFAPLYESERQRKIEKEMEVELVAEDMDFSYYEGDRIDIGEVVREQITLERPMQHLCSEGCKGLCQRCGKNLNDGPCGCPPLEHRCSFNALKSFEVSKKIRARGSKGKAIRKR